MSAETHSRLTVEGTTATITIHTEGGLNVMSSDAVARLGDAVRQAATHHNVRFTVIRATGKVFVAGADIKEMADYDPEAARRFGALGSGVCHAIAQLPCVTLAAIQGAALGGGCEIAMACDFRIATANVKIGLPEVTLGVIPGWGGIPRAAKLLGETVAKRLVFSGTPVSADEALRIGLVDQVVADSAALDQAVEDFRASFAKAGPVAISLAKRAMRDGRDVAAFADCFTGPEAREGTVAFSEKRPARWVSS